MSEISKDGCARFVVCVDRYANNRLIGEAGRSKAWFVDPRGVSLLAEKLRCVAGAMDECETRTALREYVVALGLTGVRD